MNEEKVQNYNEPSKENAGARAVENNIDINLESRDISGEVAGLIDLLNKHTSEVNEVHRDSAEEKAASRSMHLFLVAGSIIGIVLLIAKLTPIDVWLSFKDPMVVLRGMLLSLYVVVVIYSFFLSGLLSGWSFSTVWFPTLWFLSDNVSGTWKPRFTSRVGQGNGETQEARPAPVYLSVF